MAKPDYQELISALEEAPLALRRLIKDIEQERLIRKPSDKDWSILEHICHLRDIEQEGYAARIERILTYDQPFLPDIDGDKLAVERAYKYQQFDEALLSFIVAREKNLTKLRGLSGEQMSRSALMQGVGVITLAQLIAMMRDHDSEHLKQLIELTV